VGVTPDFLPARRRTKYTVYDRYLRALRAGGALPVVLEPEPTEVAEQLELVDGLLLPGGDDLDPSLWGEPVSGRYEPSDPRRTAYELALVEGALDRDLPLLGICLGLQTINVALGGSVVQDLPPGGVRHQDRGLGLELRHDVLVEAGSLLARALGRPEGGAVSVNSYHHQAPARPGRGLRVGARATDGVIEGLESAERTFCLGVQWHPDADHERDPGSASLFASFVAACRGAASGGG
jgi:putative glutamine amidotransferase